MTKTGRFVNNFLKKNYGFRESAWPKLLRRNIFLAFTVCAVAKERPSLTTMQSGPFQTRRYAVAPLGLKRAACRSKRKNHPKPPMRPPESALEASCFSSYTGHSPASNRQRWTYPGSQPNEDGGTTAQNHLASAQRPVPDAPFPHPSLPVPWPAHRPPLRTRSVCSYHRQRPRRAPEPHVPCPAARCTVR